MMCQQSVDDVSSNELNDEDENLTEDEQYLVLEKLGIASQLETSRSAQRYWPIIERDLLNRSDIICKLHAYQNMNAIVTITNVEGNILENNIDRKNYSLEFTCVSGNRSLPPMTFNIKG